MSSYFYSGQIRRFLQQFIRVLNNFEVELGQNRNGVRTLIRVPIYYGDSSRQVASIIAKNSENNLPSVPAMSVYVSDFVYDRARLQEPQFVSKMQVRQRAYDPTTGQFTQYQGDLLSVERLMPVPYMLTLKVDIWTSNTDQKFQLLEQIAVLFNPSLELQNSDSYVDWTSLSYITLTGSVFSSRTVPIGTEDPIDVSTLTFELPVWLSAPAKVKRQGVIQKILANVYDAQGTIDQDNEIFDIAASVFATQRIYTPINLNVVYLGNTLKLYVNDSEIAFDDGTVPPMTVGDWTVAVRTFGELSGTGNVDLLTNGISQVRLENDGITVVGSVAYHPTDPSLLLFNVDTDTMPVNTLTAISAIVDPRNVTVTSALLNPTVGTRYLILDNIGHTDNDDNDPATIDGAPLWNRAGQPQLIANANDIIQWDGSKWLVSFDSQLTTSVQYVTNLTTGVQYKWKNNQWSKSVEGRYGVGAWSFVPN
jgi:hypothetical protein